jgi:hypothetical protein
MANDPFGHGVRLIELLGRGYDKIAEHAESAGSMGIPRN